ncbi:MAG: trimethylamine methyltransferase family protein [Gammaproteobacteria bacterium]|nr:trimethylamine methyltransferase family protein [Gammaproteobacteria bacterium]
MRNRKKRGNRPSRTGPETKEASGIQQLPWQQVQNPCPPFETLAPEQVESIDAAAMKILENTGLRFQNDEALSILESHGAEVNFDTCMVKMDENLVRKHIATCPELFTLHARNPRRDVKIGRNYINFTPVSGPPNISDLDRDRRPGTYEDQCNLVKLAHCLNIVNMSGASSVEAMDLPADTRHLDLYRAQIIFGDQVWNARAIGRQRVEDAIQLNCIARGIGPEQMADAPGLLTVINVNSPLVVDKEMLEGLMAMTRHGLPCIVTPFTLAGAMSPITLAGALAQQTAEALAVIAFVQMVRPHCPVVFGGFTSNVDMRSGSPAFGTPEYIKGVLVGGQLARYYKLPYRSSNVNASNDADAQATYESAMSVWACFLSHANIINHAVGWMEGGLCASMEKYIIDAEMLQTMVEAFKPLRVSEEEFGFDSIREAGHGGHFFGTAHTMERYKTAFYTPLLSDWQNFENWQQSGAKSATVRANEIWKSLLENYQAPPIDQAVIVQMDEYIRHRKEEIRQDGIV